MESKAYNSPELSLTEIKEVDIITTSDIEAGVETVPLPSEPGTWETI